MEDLSFEEVRDLYPDVHDEPKSWFRSWFKKHGLTERCDLFWSAAHGDLDAMCEVFCWRTSPGHIVWWMHHAEIWDNTGEMPEILQAPLMEGWKAACDFYRKETGERWIK